MFSNVYLHRTAIYKMSAGAVYKLDEEFVVCNVNNRDADGNTLCEIVIPSGMVLDSITVNVTIDLLVDIPDNKK